MKRYLGLWTLLVAALAITVAIAYATGSLPLQPSCVAGHDSGIGAKQAHGHKASVEVDSTAQTILFIGDSMLEGLSPRLAAYANENGDTLVSVIWYSSTTEIWGRSDKLRAYIEQYKPTFIFICLGSNELFVQNIQAKRQRWVDALLAQIGDIPFVWIGPPNWKPDTGINSMIAASVGDGRYYKSMNYQYERSNDGAHPTRKAATVWMDRVCKWVVDSSAHPIKLDVPKQSHGKCRVVVLQPVR